MTKNGWKELLVDWIPTHEQKSLDLHYTQQPGKFGMILSPSETPSHALITPHLPANMKVGQQVEFSPQAVDMTRSIMSKMTEDSTWICIDYGLSTFSSNSLRVYIF